MRKMMREKEGRARDFYMVGVSGCQGRLQRCIWLEVSVTLADDTVLAG